MEKLRFCVLAFSLLEFYVTAREEYMSALGDPGMRRDSLRVAIEAWNQCNEVGEEAAGYGSPRMADCFDLGVSNGSFGGINASNADVYAAKKEIYLGDKCQVQDNPRPWQFWMIMVKSGNMDTLAATCPENGKKSMPFPPESGFPCFGHGYANQMSKAAMSNSTSYFNITWEKEIGKGSWVFHNFLKTSSNYPWLMLYLRSDATEGYSGGYHYETRGMSKIVSIFSFQFNL
uniref:DUF7705 domain-containing protein n=1 Tax=Salix viminalis TaxID=40686 RepID=A0A6N2MTA1_SALVM